MSNLLDKASIILTPTAYNNGEALCVKPSDGSGDFDFSRNSAATRVNAQGLVENVQILSSNLVQNGDFSEEGVQEVSNGSFSQEGSELITNGDFSNGSTGWSKSTQVTIENGVANIISNDGSFQVLVQNNITTIGKSYVLTYTIVSNNDGGLKLGNIGEINSAIGTHSFYFVATETPINIARNSGITDISIDNISVREVGQDWTLGTGVSIGENKAVFTSTPSGQSVSQNAVASQIPNGTSVKVSFEVLSISSGSFGVYFSGSLVGSLNSVGVATFYFEKGTETSFYIRALGTTTGSITNISVKEVGQNWNLGYNWSIGNGVAICNVSSSFLSQGNILLSNKKYKISFEITEYISGEIRAVSDGYLNTSEYFNSLGVHDFIFNCGTLTSSTLFFQPASFNGSITNISVIEITTDTSLPRINYEGFSYQDALGSELVTNGDFATDSNWNKDANWSIANGVATSTGAGRMFQSIPFLETNVGTKVKVSFDITERTSGGVRIDCYGAASQVYTDVGTHTFIGTTTNSLNLYINNAGQGNLVGSIDNVSVKEYLGQEVVPDSGCGSWLFEPQSTNLVTDSQNYNSTYWGGQRGTLSDGGVGLFYLSPTSNVIKYEVTTTGFNQLYYRLPSAVTIGNTYTQQGYVKCDDAPYIIFQIQPLTGNPSIVWDNINNVVISSDPSIDSFNITSLNGWVKAEITYTATVASIYASLKTYFSTTTSNTQGVPIGTIAYQTFVQVEQQTYATSYIPTSGSTVTRNQDVCTNGGSLASINSTEGVLYAEIAALADGVGGAISLSDGTSNNYVYLYFHPSGTKIVAKIVVNSITVYDKNITSLDEVNYNKIAFKYQDSSFKIFANGVNISSLNQNSGNTFPINILNKLSFDNGASSTPFFGKTKALAVWKEALSDQELAELTTI